jgi:hypothetical protein
MNSAFYQKNRILWEGLFRVFKILLRTFSIPNPDKGPGKGTQIFCVHFSGPQKNFKTNIN